MHFSCKICIEKTRSASHLLLNRLPPFGKCIVRPFICICISQAALNLDQWVHLLQCSSRMCSKLYKYCCKSSPALIQHLVVLVLHSLLKTMAAQQLVSDVAQIEAKDRETSYKLKLILYYC